MLMESLYTHLRDPRDPRSSSRRTWDEADPLAAAHRKYRGAEDVYKGLLEANPDAGPEERAALRVQAERSARQAVAFKNLVRSFEQRIAQIAVMIRRRATRLPGFFCRCRSGGPDARLSWLFFGCAGTWRHTRLYRSRFLHCKDFA